VVRRFCWPTPHLYNPVSRYCTGTTKQRRIEKFGRHWCGFDKWASVRGIRADEPRRVASMAARSGRDHQTVVLPLAEAGVANTDVLAFWRAQPFDLRLPISASGATLGGNCETCVLKKRSTLLEVLAHRPEAADRMIARERRMRERIAYLPRRSSGPELRDRFFKNGESFEDLRRLALSPERPEPDLFSQEDSLDCACTD
jgi:3'-phosphoadenosine 5'-phosphosulfate sulfotransferase (PAPS reductase)/FAD synthetase